MGGADYSCNKPLKKYYQEAVIVNRADVNNRRITTSYTDENGVFLFRNRVLFDLKPGLTGYRFTLNENATSIIGYTDKSEVNGTPQYSHTVNIAFQGISERQKVIMKELDSGDFLAALQFGNGFIEIFGFEFGLSTTSYSYSPQENDGGGVITLKSDSEALEDEHPFIWAGLTSNFDNNFSDVNFILQGDFNEDFNNDFFNL